MIDSVRRLLDQEQRVIVNMINNHNGIPEQIKVLDVGCGYGRLLHLLKSHGFVVQGVDSNPVAIHENRSRGLDCSTLQEFNNTKHDNFNVILISHLIEHFLPDDLIEMLDGYLNLLLPGGRLIIATPLLSPYFYEDLTHVRPYHPESILMAFGEEEAQVCLRSRHRLRLGHIWFRRSPWKLRNSASCYRKRSLMSYRSLLDTFFTLLFILSGGFLGRKDGWVGVFEKE